MFFQNSKQVDARGGTFQDIGRDHVIIYIPHVTNIFNPGTDMADRGLGVVNNSNPDSPSHSISSPPLSITISPPSTLSGIDAISQESDRGAPTTSGYSQTEYSPISHTSSISIHSSTLPSIERQVSQFMGEGDSIQPATLESLVDKLIADLSRGRLRY